MDVTKLKRDPERLRRAITVKGKDVIAKEHLRIMIPEYYSKRGLARLGVENYILAIYAILTDDGYYAVSNEPTMVHIDPSSTTRTTVDEMEYLVFEFEPGSKILVTSTVVKEETIIYAIFNDILGKGNVPWFMNDYNTGYILDGAKEYAGSSLGENRKAVQVLVSLLARDPNNPLQNYRHSVSSFKDVDANPPFYSSIRNVQLMASNTFTKLAGSYFKEGTVSSLVTTTERVEPIEKALRQ